MRMDPFVKGPAIHTGIDLRGDTGDPVRATPMAEVAVASWQGYGKMVESITATDCPPATATCQR